MRLHWIKDAQVSASLGHGPVDKLRLGLLHARFALAQAAPRLKPGPTAARLGPDGHEMVIASTGELAVMHEVLLGREYEPQATAPEVIFDLGANVGFATLFLHRRFPDARIVAVEADARTFERLRRNVGSLPGVTVLHRAIAGTDGPVRFHQSGESIGSSIADRGAGTAAVEVPGTTITTLAEEVGAERIDLLKIDIEGAEFEALKAAPLDRVGEIIAEVHYDLGDGDEATVRDLLEGFRLRFQPIHTADRFLVYGVK